MLRELWYVLKIGAAGQGKQRYCSIISHRFYNNGREASSAHPNLNLIQAFPKKCNSGALRPCTHPGPACNTSKAGFLCSHSWKRFNWLRLLIWNTLQKATIACNVPSERCGGCQWLSDPLLVWVMLGPGRASMWRPCEARSVVNMMGGNGGRCLVWANPGRERPRAGLRRCAALIQNMTHLSSN